LTLRWRLVVLVRWSLPLLILAAGLALQAPGAWLTLLPRPAPRPLVLDAPLDASRERLLFSQLAGGDQAWQPRVEVIPGGGTRYVYQRRRGDPPLTLAQIQWLLRHPPSYAEERRAIVQLLAVLRRAGALVVLGPPRQRGAAGEWEPRRLVLRIRPDVPGKGTREFFRVLNHEAIHVAQSCRRGRIDAAPMLLGLPRQLNAKERANLAEPLYASVTPQERLLEEEAYANQDTLNLGWQLVQAHC
jgi:hypothetical protein